MREDVDLDDFATKGLGWLRLLATKTTAAGHTPRLVLKGRAAAALSHWIEIPRITQALFRPVSRSDRVLDRPFAELMDGREHDVLACMAFPRQHRTKLHSTNPIERLNKEEKRQSTRDIHWRRLSI